MCDVAEVDAWQRCFHACAETEAVESAESSAKLKPSSKASKARNFANMTKWWGKWAKKRPSLSRVFKRASRTVSRDAMCVPPRVLEDFASAQASTGTDRESFVDWLNNKATKEQKRKAATCYHFFKELEENWNHQHPQAPKAARSGQKRKYETERKLRHRAFMGRQWLEWRTQEGRDSNAKHKEFLLLQYRYPGNVPKKQKVWLIRAIKVALLEKETGILTSTSYRRTGSTAVQRTPDSLLNRPRRVKQWKCPTIAAELWDWFRDMRTAVAGTVSPNFCLFQARQIANECLKSMEKTGHFQALPQLTPQWLWRWKLDHDVCFRQPNAKYKISFAKMKDRCVATWLNVFRVRAFVELLLGAGTQMYFYGIDEKPLHFNEGGSKSIRTLEIKGQEVVRLKTDHAASRKRITLMTMTTNDDRMTSDPSRMPIEVMFKGSSPKTLRAEDGQPLRLPDDLDCSLTYSVKGSYRHEHLMDYMRRWLEEWTEERAASNDYRILLLDVARSHVDEGIGIFAWTRGYLTLYHYVGITGVLQVNDTDLHGPFQRLYLEMEERCFIARQRIKNWCIHRSRQDVLDDVFAVWRCIDHRLGIKGHKSTGLSGALDGSEDNDPDWGLGRDAKTVWTASDMDGWRKKAVDEVKAWFAAKKAGKVEITMDMWKQMVRHPKGPGIRPEGFEDEGDLDEGELPWSEPDFGAPSDELMDKDLEAEFLSSEAAGAEVLTSGAVADGEVEVLAIEEEEGETDEVISEARLLATELAELTRIRSLCMKAQLPLAVRDTNKALDRLKRRGAIPKPHESDKQRAAARSALLFQRAMRFKADLARAGLERQRGQALLAKIAADKLKLKQ